MIELQQLTKGYGDLCAPPTRKLAAEHGLRLHQLAPREASLESAYLELTRDSVEFAAASDVSPTDVVAGRAAA